MPRTRSFPDKLRAEAAQWSSDEAVHDLLIQAATAIEMLTGEVEDLKRGQAAVQSMLQVPDYPPDVSHGPGGSA